MTRNILVDRSGSGAAEFSFVLPVLMLILFGMIDTGRYMWDFNKAEKATMMGARFAVVTDPVDSDLVTTNYVGTGSPALTQGDPIPPSAFGTVSCNSTSCTCTVTPCPGLTRDGASFTKIVNRMKLMNSEITEANVVVEYGSSGLGYAGDPNGMELAPLITVKITGLQFRPLSFLMLTHITMPDFATTLTSEDSRGTASN